MHHPKHHRCNTFPRKKPLTCEDIKVNGIGIKSESIRVLDMVSVGRPCQYLREHRQEPFIVRRNGPFEAKLVGNVVAETEANLELIVPARLDARSRTVVRRDDERGQCRCVEPDIGWGVSEHVRTAQRAKVVGGARGESCEIGMFFWRGSRMAYASDHPRYAGTPRGRRRDASDGPVAAPRGPHPFRPVEPMLEPALEVVLRPNTALRRRLDRWDRGSQQPDRLLSAGGLKELKSCHLPRPLSLGLLSACIMPASATSSSGIQWVGDDRR